MTRFARSLVAALAVAILVACSDSMSEPTRQEVQTAARALLGNTEVVSGLNTSRLMLDCSLVPNGSITLVEFAPSTDQLYWDTSDGTADSDFRSAAVYRDDPGTPGEQTRYCQDFSQSITFATNNSGDISLSPSGQNLSFQKNGTDAGKGVVTATAGGKADTVWISIAPTNPYAGSAPCLPQKGSASYDSLNIHNGPGTGVHAVLHSGNLSEGVVGYPFYTQGGQKKVDCGATLSFTKVNTGGVDFTWTYGAQGPDRGVVSRSVAGTGTGRIRLNAIGGAGADSLSVTQTN